MILRFVLPALLALLMAIAVYVGGYALWVGVARAGTPTAETPTFTQPDMDLPEPRRPEVSGAANASAPRPDAIADRAPRAVGRAEIEVTAPPAGTSVVVVDAARGIEVARFASDGNSPTARSLPAGDYVAFLTAAPDRARSHYLARADLAVPADATAAVTLDGRAHETMVFEILGGPSLAEWIRTVRLFRREDPRWSAILAEDPEDEDVPLPNVRVEGRFVTFRGVPHGDYVLRLDAVQSEHPVAVPGESPQIVDVSSR